MLATQTQYIDLRPNRDGRLLPNLTGTRVRVQDVVLLHERFGQAVDEIARGFPQLSLAQVHAALTYFFEDRQAIWDCVRADEAFVSELERQQNRALDDLAHADASESAVSSR